MIYAVVIFLATYLLIATEKINRVLLTSVGAALMLIVGATDIVSAFTSHEIGIDWNVIFLLLGMMVIVAIIHRTGLFDFLAVKAIKAVKGSPKAAFIVLSLLTAVASAFLDNVTTILLAVPMTLLVSKYLKVSPVPFILGQIFASNIGGTATLIGDPPNIIIGSKAGIDFNSFIVNLGPLVLLVLVAVIPLLVFLFRKQLVNQPSDRLAIENLVASDQIKNRTLLLKSLILLTAVLVGFTFHSLTHIEPAWIAMSGALLLTAISRLKPKEIFLEVEWQTLAFFAGLFVMVGALVKVGALEQLANSLTNLIQGNGVTANLVIILGSALLSGVVDNIPYVASMTPVIQNLTETIQQSDGFWWSLAAGADFGGNLTIIGASANVVGVALATASGHRITFGQFAKYGVLVTAVSIAITIPYILLRYV